MRSKTQLLVGWVARMAATYEKKLLKHIEEVFAFVRSFFFQQAIMNGNK